MVNLRVVYSVAAGLVFGLVWVWQGVAAAFVVLAFALLGLLIGLALWVAGRVASGEIDMNVIKQLISLVFSENRRSR